MFLTYLDVDSIMFWIIYKNSLQLFANNKQK